LQSAVPNIQKPIILSNIAGGRDRLIKKSTTHSAAMYRMALSLFLLWLLLEVFLSLRIPLIIVQTEAFPQIPTMKQITKIITTTRTWG